MRSSPGTGRCGRGRRRPSRYTRYTSVSSSSSVVACQFSFTWPLVMLLAVGTLGCRGLVRSGGPPKRVKPCCALLLTVPKSPPTKSWVPSVAKARGPSGLPLVLGYQGPIEPSESRSTSRWRAPPEGTCGKEPTEEQSCACEPLYSQLPMISIAWVAPRQVFFHTRAPSLCLAAKVPSKQPPPVPSAAK